MHTKFSAGLPTSIRVALTNNELIAAPAYGIGLVAPFDFALDAECWRWLPEGVSLYITRTPRIEQTAVTIDLAREVSSETAVAQAVQSLLAVNAACVGYACTSGSFIDGTAGEQKLQLTMIKAGAPAAVTTSGALVNALRHLGISQIAVATPYNQALTEKLITFLGEAGITVVSSGHLDMESGIAKANYAAVCHLAEAVDHPDAEAIFLSCTNLWTFDVISELEAQLDKPILSANQVTMWSALQLAEITTPNINQRLFMQPEVLTIPNKSLTLDIPVTS